MTAFSSHNFFETEHNKRINYNNPQYDPMLRAPAPARGSAVNSPPGVAVIGAVNAFAIHNSMFQRGAQNAGPNNVRSRGCSTAVIFSCLVIWLCNWPIGLIAYALAVKAKYMHDGQAASRYNCGSYVVSIIGICVSVIVTTILVLTNPRYSSFDVIDSCAYHVNGQGCYTDKKCGFFSSSTCSGVYHLGCCYTN